MKLTLATLILSLSSTLALAKFNADFEVKNLKSIKQWKGYTVDQQRELFEHLSYANENIELVSTEAYPVDKITQSLKATRHKKDKAGKKISVTEKLSIGLTHWINTQIAKHYDEQIGELENNGENIATVGEPDVSVELFLLNGKILAAQFYFHQNAAHNENITYGEHFDTAKEAQDAGWDTEADVSWSNQFTINQAGALLDSQSYWDWSGW